MISEYVRLPAIASEDTTKATRIDCVVKKDTKIESRSFIEKSAQMSIRDITCATMDSIDAELLRKSTRFMLGVN
jgi:hypothetical protein